MKLRYLLNLICDRVIIQKAAFNTLYGYFNFLVMPFRVISVQYSELVIIQFSLIMINLIRVFYIYRYSGLLPE